MTAPSAISLNAMIDHHRRVRPQETAILDGDQTLSYAGFVRQVRQTAQHLTDLGIGAGGCVGIALGETATHLVALFAVARLGALAVPMDRRWTVAEKQTVIRAFDIDLILTEAADERPDACAARPVDEAWQTAVSASDAYDGGAIDPDRPFIFALSSGTTGAPTGPVLSQAHLFHRFVNQWVTLRLNGGDRFLAATPLYFGATRAFCLSTLCAGGTVILSGPPGDPAALVQRLIDTHATATFVVPTLLRRLLSVDDARLRPLQSLRVMISSGAALHAEEREAVRTRICANLYDYYGTTEGGGISILEPEDAIAGAGSVGRPAFLVEVGIVDADGKPLPPDAVGRLRYRGPGVADGPIVGGDTAQTTAKDPAATSDGWFYPGDLASIDGAGFVFLHGRDKDLIIRGGANIYPAEIEAVISRLAGVDDVAVTGIPSVEFGEDVAAFIVASGPVSENDLAAHCRENLASYKRPSRLVFLDDLPRNASGKVLKNKLKEMIGA